MRKNGQGVTERDYHDFVEQFTQRLEGKYLDICFYIYGSFAEGRHDVGRSDIDGGLILDAKTILPKQKVMDLATTLRDMLEQHPVPVQLNIFDRRISRDGRFLSYTADFTDYIKKNGKILHGLDYISEMNGLDFKSGVLNTIAFNLRRVRNNLLYAQTYLNEKEEKIEEGIKNALEVLSKLPKKLLWLQGCEIIADRFEAQYELERRLRDVDFSLLEEVNILFGSPSHLEHLISDKKEAIQIHERALTAIEALLEAYIIAYPQCSNREVAHSPHHNHP